MSSKEATATSEPTPVQTVNVSLRDQLTNHPGSHTFVAPRYPKWDWEKVPYCEGKVLGVREAKTMRDGKAQVLTVMDMENDSGRFAIICTRNLRNLASKSRVGDMVGVQYIGWQQDSPGSAPSRGFKAVIQHANGQIELA